jgi:Type IV secretion-system coupling protein DNA-binding domain/TraM recognition site of TraD and TraG
MRPRPHHSHLYTRARAAPHATYAHHAAHGGGGPPTIARFLQEPNQPWRELGHLASRVLHALLGLAPALASAVVVAVLVVRLAAWLRERRLSGEGRLIEIGVPPEVDAQGGLALWSTLHDILRPHLRRLLAGQPQLSWEITASEAGTAFRVWVPRALPPGLIERALASAWPGASATPREVAEPAQPAAGASASDELVLSGPDWFSLQSATSPDPLPMILGQLAGMSGAERALVQVIARPATSREQRRLRAAARRIRRGQPASMALRILQLLSTQPAPPRLDPTVNPDVREVMVKSAAPLFRCLIRVSVTAASAPEARGRIHAVLGAFAPYAGARVWLRRRRAPRSATRVGERRLGRRAFLLGVPELAALAHLPTSAAIPGVISAGAREVPPPPGLPAQGRPLGVSGGRQVSLAVADARQHVHVLGPTGVGKSTLIANLALADLHARRGAIVIDPKGDLVEDLLARIPRGREDDVELLDPLDPSPPGLNVLDSPDRDLGVDQLVGIFRRVFERFWGPRTDDILRAALLTLTYPAAELRATLADVPRLLSDSTWRAEVLETVDDPVGLEPFWAWYEELSEPLRAQITGPLLNKLRAFLLRAPVRAIVGQPTTTLDVARAINDGRLLLAKLPKGTLGEDTSRLLGSFIVARVWQAALARAEVAPERRVDAALYVDEVHNYLNLPTPFEDIAAEARGYRLSLCLAHQHLAQLPRDLREALAANARTKIYFQLSRDDATHLEREMRPELAAHDLAHLPAYTAAVRLCQDGQPSRAFTLSTQPLPAPIDRQADRVREAARRRYGSAREQIEQQIAARHRRRKELHRRPRTPSVPQRALPVADPVGDPVGEPVGDPVRTGSPPPARSACKPAETTLGARARQGRGSENV